MPWVKIDDHFPEHPKVSQAGPLAMAMQVAALCYCNRKLTDGFVPRGIARTLLDWEFVTEEGVVYTVGITSGMSGQDVESPMVIDVLVAAGMWEEVPGGYMIHDYHDFQPSKADVEAERDAARDRMKAVREKRKGSSSEVRANNNRSSCSPVPVPVPEEPSSSARSSTTSNPPPVDEEEEVITNARSTAGLRALLRRKATSTEPIIDEKAWLKADAARWDDANLSDARRILHDHEREGSPLSGAQLDAILYPPRALRSVQSFVDCDVCAGKGYIVNADDLEQSAALECVACDGTGRAAKRESA